MRKLKFLTASMLLFTAFNFTSCSDDDSVAAVQAETPPPASVGNYWPAAVNNQWVFDLNGSAQDPMKIVSEDNVDGNNYFTFSAPDTPGTQRLRKNGGDYLLKLENITVDVTGFGSGTLSNFETTVLKDYLEEDATWTESFSGTVTFAGLPVPIATQMTITCTIEEKDGTHEVNGVTYTDVIIVRRDTQISGANQNITSLGYYWFSKDIGPIKIIEGDDEQTLLSHILY